jgi:excisionase family DNA binding protein
MPELDLVSRKEIMSAFGVSDPTLRCWMRKFGLPFIKIGKTIRFRRSDILAFAERHSAKSAPEGEGSLENAAVATV